MLIFAVKKKRIPSIAPKHHAPTVSPMSHSLHLQQAKVSHILRSPTVQPKLIIGAPNDKYEQEADRVAEQVMRMPEPRIQRQVEPEEEETLQAKPLVSQITPLVNVQRQEEPEEEEETLQPKPLASQITPLVQVQRQEEPEEEEETLQTKPLADQITPLVVQRQEESPEEEEEVQRKLLQKEADEEEKIQKQPEEDEEMAQAKGDGGNSPAVSPSVESGINTMRRGASPLPESSRAFFEPRFSADFSGVKVHTDSNAAHLARSVNAKAFTVGRDVFFGSGKFSPETTGGKKLLAHELTHVVQQNGGGHVRKKRALPPLSIVNTPDQTIQLAPRSKRIKLSLVELRAVYVINESVHPVVFNSPIKYTSLFKVVRSVDQLAAIWRPRGGMPTPLRAFWNWITRKKYKRVYTGRYGWNRRYKGFQNYIEFPGKLKKKMWGGSVLRFGKDPIPKIRLYGNPKINFRSRGGTGVLSASKIYDGFTGKLHRTKSSILSFALKLPGAKYTKLLKRGQSP